MTEDATVISETVAPQAVIHCSLSGKIAGFVRKNTGSNPASVFSIHTRVSVVCPTMGVWMRALIMDLESLQSLWVEIVIGDSSSDLLEPK